MFSCVYLVLFELRFYGPVNPLGHVERRQLTYPHFYSAGLVLTWNWQLPFLNLWKGENDHRKYFMINLLERMLPAHQGSNPQPPDHQSDVHPTEPPISCIFHQVLSIKLKTQVCAAHICHKLLISILKSSNVSSLYIFYHCLLKQNIFFSI